MHLQGIVSMSTGRRPTIDISRLRVLIFVLTFGFTVVVGRLVYYQVIRHEELKAQALDQRTWDKELYPKRGYIADVNGHILALDISEWDVSVSPTLVTDQAELAGQLSELLGMPMAEVSATLTAEEPWLQLAKGVDYEVGEAIAGLEARGITCTPRPRRYYPEGSLFAHLLGIVNSTGYGFYGVEGYYDQQLRGNKGTRRIEQDPAGEELPIPPLAETPSQAGTSLILTVDRNIQYIAAQELRRSLEEFGADGGTVVILQPQTGAILAAVSYPSYDPNDFVNEDPDLLADSSVSKMWEPGSIFKIVTWAAGLDSGTINPNTTFYDEGALEVGGRVIRNWDRRGYGLVTMTDGLVQSLNTVAAFMSTSMGKDKFYTYLRRFGFGTLTTVDLASEGPGMVKLPGDSDWFPSELGTNSFGQGIAVTPMQMIVAVSAVANRGTMVKPHIVHQFVAQDPESGEPEPVVVEPMIVRRTISQESAETLTGMLVEVVEQSATRAQVPGYRIAGKTGTAQIPTPYGYHPHDTIASFVGFAPADDPQFIVLVKLDKPTASPWGSQTAAPTFRAIAERLFAYMQIPPDEIRLAQQQ
jgi:cell division protein FtsI/penicillin-binding protein 2